MHDEAAICQPTHARMARIGLFLPSRRSVPAASAWLDDLFPVACHIWLPSRPLSACDPVCCLLSSFHPAGGAVSAVAAPAALAYLLSEVVDNSVDGGVPREGMSSKISAHHAGAPGVIRTQRALSTDRLVQGRRVDDESRVPAAQEGVRFGVYTSPMTTQMAPALGSVGGGLKRCVRFLLHEHPVVVRTGSGWDSHPQGAVVGDQEHSPRVESVQVLSGLFWWDAHRLSEVSRKVCPNHDLIELTRGHDRNARPVGPAVLQHESHGESGIGVPPEGVVDLVHRLFVRTLRRVPLSVVDTWRFEVVQVPGAEGPLGPRTASLPCVPAGVLLCPAGHGVLLLGCHAVGNDGLVRRFPSVLSAQVRR